MNTLGGGATCPSGRGRGNGGGSTLRRWAVTTGRRRGSGTGPSIAGMDPSTISSASLSGTAVMNDGSGGSDGAGTLAAGGGDGAGGGGGGAAGWFIGPQRSATAFAPEDWSAGSRIDSVARGAGEVAAG